MQLPIDSLFKIAVRFALLLAVVHPMTWRVELAKLEYRMLKEATDTRSWGNVSIWQQRHHTGPK